MKYLVTAFKKQHPSEIHTRVVDNLDGMVGWAAKLLSEEWGGDSYEFEIYEAEAGEIRPLAELRRLWLKKVTQEAGALTEARELKKQEYERRARAAQAAQDKAKRRKQYEMLRREFEPQERGMDGMNELRQRVPQTLGEALDLYPWIERHVAPHEWDNRTTLENATWLLEFLGTVWGNVEMQRQDEGSAVTLHADNADEAEAAVEVSAWWTEWETEAYEGRNLPRALSEAVRAQQAETGALEVCTGWKWGPRPRRGES